MKRGFDFIAAFLILILCIPILIFISIVIIIFQGKPVFFTQSRVGVNNRIFRIVKFCTMRDMRGTDGELLPDELRTTRIGRFLRTSSIDEVPGLFNVLRGEMSLVGPRPLPPIYLDRYSQAQARRHEVKPGITGWAQINGRNTISWEQKFLYDVWYVDHQTIWLDIKILIMTVFYVLKRADIVPTDKPAMEEFMGSTPAARSGEDQ